MDVRSIAETLSRLEPSRAKLYERLYDDHGYELGFGRRGCYPGHSHFHFCDVMFSPSGILTAQHEGASISGQLVVVPPRTYFADTSIGDFFFIKFCPHSGAVAIPDKTDAVLTEGRILAYDDTADLELDWYPVSAAARRSLGITLAANQLTVRFADVDTVVVEP